MRSPTSAALLIVVRLANLFTNIDHCEGQWPGWSARRRKHNGLCLRPRQSLLISRVATSLARPLGPLAQVLRRPQAQGAEAARPQAQGAEAAHWDPQAAEAAHWDPQAAEAARSGPQAAEVLRPAGRTAGSSWRA